MESTELFIELAKAVPNLVVFLLLVFFLTRGQRLIAEKLSGGIVDYMKARDERIEDFFATSNKAIVENSEALIENAKRLGEVAAHMAVAAAIQKGK